MKKVILKQIQDLQHDYQTVQMLGAIYAITTIFFMTDNKKFLNC